MEHLGSEDRSEFEFKVHRLLSECFWASHLKDSLSIRRRGKWWNLKLSVKVRLCVCSSPLSIKVILRQWLRWETVTWSLKDTSVQFSSVCSVTSNSLWPHKLQHTRLPHPPTTGAKTGADITIKSGNIQHVNYYLCPYTWRTSRVAVSLWQSVKTALLQKEMQVWSLLGELRSGLLQGAAKNKKTRVDISFWLSWDWFICHPLLWSKQQFPVDKNRLRAKLYDVPSPVPP